MYLLEVHNSTNDTTLTLRILPIHKQDLCQFTSRISCNVVFTVKVLHTFVQFMPKYLILLDTIVNGIFLV